MQKSPTYTEEQLQQYFSYIKLPSYYHATSQEVQSRDKQTQIDWVNRLIRHQLTHIPWENLDLHYSTVKGISIDPRLLFRKIVTNARGRGGYCMQNNLFFATILRSLGFTVSSHGARVAKTFGISSQKFPIEEVDYTGFGHQINIITFADDSKYFCDVGFGSAGPTSLIPLKEGYTGIVTGTQDQPACTMTLKRGWTARNVTRNETTELWIYSVKYGPLYSDLPWNICYCFTDIEFEPEDYERMSWHISTSRNSMFVNKVLVTKFIMSEDGESLVGDVTLVDGSLKERVWGENRELCKIEKESDRVEAMEKFLSIKLTDDERAGISGFPTEIQRS